MKNSDLWPAATTKASPWPKVWRSPSATIVVYKMGEKGAITFADNEEIRTGIYPANALKPTGAGDSFMAGAIASLADGYDLRSSVFAWVSLCVHRCGQARGVLQPCPIWNN